jgi:transcriptional regulator with XRE-family HTH domain
MLADFLLIDGWAVTYLGASTPVGDLVDFVARRHPDLVALSVTQPEHLPAVSATATALRGVAPVPKVLAGGAALRGRPRAAATLGVDGVAADALSGMHEARRLIAEPPPVGATSEDYFQRLGRRVQELRSGKGWTQQQLAEAAGLDRTYISGLEHGKQNPTLGALLRLTGALGALDRLVIIGTGAAGEPPWRRPWDRPGAGTCGSPPAWISTDVSEANVIRAERHGCLVENFAGGPGQAGQDARHELVRGDVRKPARSK